MEIFWKSLGELLSTGSAPLLIVVAIISVLGLSVFFAIKLFGMLKGLGGTAEHACTRDDVDRFRADVARDTTRVEEAIKDVDDDISTIQTQLSSHVQRDISLVSDVEKIINLINEMKYKYSVDSEKLNSLEHNIIQNTEDLKRKESEISTQIQSLQRDLASLHGSILAMNASDRTRLK